MQQRAILRSQLARAVGRSRNRSRDSSKNFQSPTAALLYEDANRKVDARGRSSGINRCLFSSKQSRVKKLRQLRLRSFCDGEGCGEGDCKLSDTLITSRTILRSTETFS